MKGRLPSSTVRVLLACIVLLSIGYWVIGPGTVTVRWQEEVELLSGETLIAARELDFARDEWGRSGRGPMTAERMSFLADGRSVVWRNADPRRAGRMPDVLEIIDGIPMIVLSVDDWWTCVHYDFPREGLVVLEHRDGGWIRVPIARVPAEARVNLMRNEFQLQRVRDRKQRLVSIGDKAVLEHDQALDPAFPRQGTPIGAAARYYASRRDACETLRPPATEVERRRATLSGAEREATEVAAALVSVDTQRVVPAPSDYVVNHMSGGSPPCNGYRLSGTQVFEHSGSAGGHSARHLGWDLVLAGDETRSVPLAFGDVAMLQAVYCERDGIYTISRSGPERLVVSRFSHEGDLIDVWKVLLPMQEPRAGVHTMPWSIETAAGGGLLLTLADVVSNPAAVTRRETYAIPAS